MRPLSLVFLAASLALIPPALRAQNCSEREPNETASNASTLMEGDCTGNAGDTDPSQTGIPNRPKGFAPLQDLWVYKATVTFNINLTMTINSTNADLDMYIVQIAGNTVINKVEAVSETTTRTERIVRTFPAGTYYIGIAAINGLSGYVLKTIITPTTPPPVVCNPSATTLCLRGNRFIVRTRWTTNTGVTGDGNAVSLTTDTGYFWFFNSANVEEVVKVVDACGFPSAPRFWVFATGLTDVAVETTVIDTKTGATQTYSNPQGIAFIPVQDTNAFATCP